MKMLTRSLLFALLLQAWNLNAMNLNLALPWSEPCSPPQKSEFMFYSRDSETLLFEECDMIAIRCQVGVHAVGMKWTLARNMFATPFRSGAGEPLISNQFSISIPTKGLYPGFYDLRVVLDSGIEKPREGVCTFGYRVAEMAIRDSRPADFSKFWSRAKAALASVPLDAREEAMQTFTEKQINEYNVKSACLPMDYDPTGHRCKEVESAKVTFAAPGGARVHGWLAKPMGKGPFPAMLVLPGGGFSPRPRPLEHARHGYVALDIQIHGQDVDQPKYENIPGHFDHQVYQPAEAFYYYQVYLRALQAVNYLKSRPDVDPKRITLVGGSQGGRLAVVLAGLDPSIHSIVPCIAHFGNQPYMGWAEQCNREGKDGMDLDEPPVMDTPEQRCFAYYDPMNFAPDIHCPVLMNGGLIDTASAPSGVWAIYKRLGTRDKKIMPLTGLGHDWSAEFDRRAWRWLDR